MTKLIERMVELKRSKDGMRTARSVAIAGATTLLAAGSYQWRCAILDWMQSLMFAALHLPL